MVNLGFPSVSDGRGGLIVIASVQKRQVLLILAKHHVLRILLHVPIIGFARVSDGKHDFVAGKMLFIPLTAVTIFGLSLFGVGEWVGGGVVVLVG